ncbi:MAG: maleylpyruvate isomerase family mycothiol-dependent enzyme [Ilumatobacteraceae bacterium]
MKPDEEILGLLAEATAAAPPAALGPAVVVAATATRPSGRAIDALGGGKRAAAKVAFLQTIDEFKALLADAPGSAIVEPYGWSVTQLVAHLLEIDLYFGRQLGLWAHDIDDSLEDDHLAMTEAAVRGSVRADFDSMVAKWLEVSAAVCAHVESLGPDQLAEPIKFHMLDTRVSTMLVVRVFEVWTHLEDLSRTLRRDPPPLDAERLHLMTTTAVRAIPFGMLLGNVDGGDRTARLVLTGLGGGVWHQPLYVGSNAGEPAVTIVADALEFCRLAAQRILPADLDAEIEGPTDLAIDVLRGASVFAA